LETLLEIAENLGRRTRETAPELLSNAGETRTHAEWTKGVAGVRRGGGIRGYCFR
jgi:hypothetical protein